MTGGGGCPRLGWAPAPRAGGGGCRPSPLLLALQGANQRAPSWHAEPSRGAGDSERRGRGPRGDAPDGWGAGGGLARRSETHKRQRRPPAGGLLGRRGAQGGGKDQGPLGAGFSLGPHPLPRFGSRLPAKGCGRQTEARGGKRHPDEGWRCRLCARIIAVLGGARVASVVPRRWDAGSFRCWSQF